MMAPGPLDALPALLDIVANDERAAELSAALYGLFQFNQHVMS